MNQLQKIIVGLIVGAVTFSSVVSSSGTPRYIVKEQNHTCLMLEADIAVAFDYKESNGTQQHVNYTVPSNENATVTDGACGKDMDTLIISWKGQDPDYDLLLHFYFNKTEKDGTYRLANISLHGNVGRDDHKVNMSSAFHNFTTDVGSSYNCSRKSALTMKGGATITFTHLRIEAFKNDTAKTPTFSSTVNDCEGPHYTPTDAIVPIAVGAALAAMVVIVLIGYCIGRRKTRAGYQSMNA